MKKCLIALLMAFWGLLAWPQILFSQSDFEHNLSKNNANKIILLGEWKAGDIGKWGQIINSEGIYEYGFALLSRGSFLDGQAWFGIRDNDINEFEGWIRQKYGLDNRATWIALETGDNIILSGVETPRPGEFLESLEKFQIMTTSKLLRAFLRENPDHIDARTDLLKEVRRRALQQLSTATEDLDLETDLRTWGVLADETDKLFNSNWMGVDLGFF